jgi:REP element-mobilizing transposase RayT
MPDHVHLVITNLRYPVEIAAELLKQAATMRLMEEDIHPFREFAKDGARPPTCFARGEGKGFLDPEDVAPCIKYVEDNPIKAGLRRQRWGFVTPRGSG